MRINRSRVAKTSELTIDGDLDFLTTFQAKNLATPAATEATRKGSKDVTMAEISDTIKNAASGLVKLDASADVPDAQIPNLNASKITAGRFPNARLGWTAAKFLQGAGATNDPTEVDAPAGMPTPAAGDLILASSAAEKPGDSANRTTYVKVKEISVGRTGEYRIKFSLRNSSGYIAYGRIYKNGAAVGTEQTEDSDASVVKSEDLAGWASGDLCQLYLKSSNLGFNAWVKDFEVYADNRIIDIVTQEEFA